MSKQTELNDLNDTIKWFKTVKRNNDMACILPDQSMMKNIIKWLEKLKEYESRKNKEEWIPVEEKMPESDEYILISFENFNIPDIGRYEVDKEGNGAFYPGDDETSYAQFGLFANAWRPLPKAYKEKK